MRGVYGQKWRTSGYHWEGSVKSRSAGHGGFWAHLVNDVVQRVRAVNGEADKDEVGLGVREGSQTIILFLTGRVP